MNGGGGSQWQRPKSGPGSAHNPSTGHAVHMRGLPRSQRISETDLNTDIMTFFNPISPAAIHLHYESVGCFTGTADVDFYTFEDAQDATKNGEYIRSHYVDLFLNTVGPPQDQSGPNTHRGHAIYRENDTYRNNVSHPGHGNHQSHGNHPDHVIHQSFHPSRLCHPRD